MYDLESLRRDEFPHSAKITYLNHAAIAPLPQRSKKTIQGVVEQLSGDPSTFFMNHAMPAFTQFAEQVARHINAASPAEIVPTTSTSAALNAVAQAIDWRPGDNLLFCDVEFPANAYPWMSLTRDGVATRCVPAADGGLSLNRVEEFCDEQTRAVAVSAVQFLTGHRADLAAIGRFCHENGLFFIVDAIQAIGHIPIDVQAMHIDVLATGGQKSLLALPGTGFLYVREKAAETMQPRLIHSNATTDYLHWLAYDLTPLPGAARFMSGTPNVPGILGIISSLELIGELGIANIDAHTAALTRYGGELLNAAGYEVITPLNGAGPILTFCSPVDSAATDQLIQQLAAHRIIAGKHLDAEGVPYIRLSFHAYNITAEIDHFMEALEAFVN
jgi:selenocysteine lyase/cysteine desulfurase